MQSLPTTKLCLCEEYDVPIDDSIILGLSKQSNLENINDISRAESEWTSLEKLVCSWREDEGNIDEIVEQVSNVDKFTRGFTELQCDIENYIQELESTVEELQDIILYHGDVGEDLTHIKELREGLDAARGRRDKRIKDKSIKLC